MVGHYHIAHQRKTILLIVKLQFLKEDSAELLVPEIGAIFVSVRGGKMKIGIIIEFGRFFVHYHFLFNSWGKGDHLSG